jgi:hypothetical protein
MPFRQLTTRYGGEKKIRKYIAYLTAPDKLILIAAGTLMDR